MSPEVGRIRKDSIWKKLSVNAAVTISDLDLDRLFFNKYLMLVVFRLHSALPLPDQ